MKESLIFCSPFLGKYQIDKMNETQIIGGFSVLSALLDYCKTKYFGKYQYSYH